MVGFLVEIYRQTLTQRSRLASGWKMEWKFIWGMRWGSPRIFSVGTELGEVEGYVVGN